MSDQQQGFDWSGLWKAMTEPNEKWFGPNTQVGLGQMAKAMNPSGVTGNAGEMFANYVQGVQTQQAMAQQMKQRQELMTHIYKALGLIPQAGQEAKQQLATGSQLSSDDWDKNWGRGNAILGGLYDARK